MPLTGCVTLTLGKEVSTTKLIAALNKSVRLPGETLTDFAAEVRKLTPKDKRELAEAFEAEGTVVDDKDTFTEE